MRVLLWGTNSKEHEDFNQRIILHNTIIVSLIGVAFTYFLIFAVINQPFLSIIAFFINLTLVSCLLLNRSSFYTLSRLLLQICSVLSVFFYSTVLGEASGIYVFNFALTAVPMVTFSPKEKWCRLFAVSMPLLSFFLLRITRFSLLTHIPLEPAYTQLLSWSISFLTFVIIIVSLQFLYKKFSITIASLHKETQEKEAAFQREHEKLLVIESQNHKIESDKKELEAKLLQDTLLLAGGLTQRQMLQTDFPKSDLFDISVLYTPSNSISGDFYWAMELEDGRIASMVFDVTGHGVPAAIIMTAVAKLTEDIHKQAHMFPLHEPAKMLTLLNKAMFDTRCIQKAVACVYSVYDPILRKVLYAYAGGEALVVIRDQAFIRLEGDHGFPLRMVDDSEYVEHTVQLEPGDLLLAYSDGLYELKLNDGSELVTTFINQENRLSYNYFQFQHLLNQRSNDHRFTHYLAETFQALCKENKDDLTVLVLEVCSVSK